MSLWRRKAQINAGLVHERLRVAKLAKVSPQLKHQVQPKNPYLGWKS